MITTDNINKLIANSTPEEYKKFLSHLTLDQIPLITQALNNLTLKPKLKILLETLSERKSIELMGISMTPEQSLVVLDILNIDPSQEWKLSPLLVGMPHSTFSKMLLATSPSHLDLLKREVFAEPLQHHLTLMTHEIVQQTSKMSTQLDSLELKITDLDLNEIKSEQINRLIHEIENNAKEYQILLECINKLLSLTWNTDRSDLIEKLSSCKEIAQKLIVSRVGSPKTLSENPKGLFAQLEQKLSEVFEGFKPQEDIEALDDDEPAMEALVKFSLWYLRDYWEIGLLPSIKNPADIEKYQTNTSISDQIHAREELYRQVNLNLEKLNLKTVGDLKQHQIFSKISLKDYIITHKNLIS